MVRMRLYGFREGRKPLAMLNIRKTADMPRSRAEDMLTVKKALAGSMDRRAQQQEPHVEIPVERGLHVCWFIPYVEKWIIFLQRIVF